MSSRRSPGLSVRLQLTLSYAALVVLAGFALFAVGLLIVRFIPEGNLIADDGGFAPGRDDLIEVFVRYSAVALLCLAIIGLVGGWYLAGHMLKPLTRVTDAARLARDGSLTHRIDLPGRHNELSELADTFDDMLARVQRSIDEQRRFAANASHELRTPLAVMRTMLEVASADPSQRRVDELIDRLTQTNERSIALIEALLALSDVEHRERALEHVSIDRLVIEELEEVERTRGPLDVSVNTALRADTLEVRADPMLLRLLVANLLTNAIVHNQPGGSISISTSGAERDVVLEVSNTGAPLEQSVVDTLAEPFVRGAGRARAAGGRADGPGLGLAIVSSIAQAHDASLRLVAREGGGLSAMVRFPR